MGKDSPEVRHRSALLIDGAVGVALVVLLVVTRGGISPALVGAAYAAVVSGRLVRTDVREHRLPNALVLPGFVFAAVGLVWEALARGSPEPLLATASLGGAVAGGLLALASGGGLGMGDVKLATLLAVALAGVGGGEAGGAVLAFVGAAFLAGGAVGLSALLRSGRPSLREEVAFGPVLLAAFWAVAVLW
jgi:leader peptidase (prepilin peptidase)/N-methyltransferase